MKNIAKLLLVICIFTACKKGAFKNEEGSFKANGVAYKTVEDDVYAEYVNNVSDFLSVRLTNGPNQTFQTKVTLDLSKINVTVPIDSGAEGFYYVSANSAVSYFPISGEYKVTNYKEGNPATRYIEGNFSFVAVNQYDATDTIRITEGYFYANNY